MSDSINQTDEMTVNIDQYQKELKQAKTADNPVELSKIHEKIAKTYFEAKEYEDGLKHFDKAINQAKRINDRPLEAFYLGSKGTAYLHHKLPEEGFLCFQQILEIAEEINDLGLKSDALGSMGLVYMETGDPGLAIEKLRQALELAEELEDLKRTMAQNGALGNTYLLLAATEDAEKHFERALDISIELGDPQSRAGYLNNLGIIFDNSGRKSEAKLKFEEVLSISREIKDQYAERNALKFLINLELELNPHSELVLTYLENAIALSRQLNDTREIKNYRDYQIMILLRLNRQADAISAIIGELEDEDQDGDIGRKINLYSNLGNAHYDLSELAKATEAYQNGLDTATEHEVPAAEARLLGKLGAVCADQGEFEQGKKYTGKALKLAETLNDVPLQAEQLSLLAMTYADLNQKDKAEELANKALELFKEAGHKLFVERIHSFLNDLKSK